MECWWLVVGRREIDSGRPWHIDEHAMQVLRLEGEMGPWSGSEKSSIPEEVFRNLKTDLSWVIQKLLRSTKRRMALQVRRRRPCRAGACILPAELKKFPSRRRS